MRIVAIHKSTHNTVEILGVQEIAERDGIYYISGEFDPRSITSKPLTVMCGSTMLFKTSKMELDDRMYYSIELSN